MRGEVQESGVGGAETARLEVEGAQMRFEVHVQPGAPGVLGRSGGAADELGADAEVLVVRADLRVEQERVVGAVPGDVDEADERSAGEVRAAPAEAVLADPVPPPVLGVPAVRGGQLHQFAVGQVRSPAVVDIGHPPRVAGPGCGGRAVFGAEIGVARWARLAA